MIAKPLSEIAESDIQELKDAGIEEGEGVTQAEVFQVFAENIGRLRDVLMKVIADLPDDRACPCPRALDGIKLPFELP